MALRHRGGSASTAAADARDHNICRYLFASLCELARVRERLRTDDLTPGIAAELEKHVAVLEQEIGKIEGRS